MNKSLMGSLLDMVRQYRVRLFFAFILVLTSNLLLILNPLIFRQAILAVSTPDGGISSWEGAFFHTLLGPVFHCAYSWAYLLIGIATVSAILKYFMRMIFISIGREVEVRVRNQLFERIQGQSRAFFDQHGIGDLISRLTNDITAYRDLLGPGIMYPVFFITLVIPALIALFFLSPLMAAISLIPIVSIYFFHLAIRRPLLQVSLEVQQSLGEMSVMAHEHFSGIRILRSYGIEKVTAALFKQICLRFNKLNMRFVCFQGMVFPVLTLIIKAVTILIVLIAGAIILLGWGNMRMADFLSFMWIQSYIFSPLLMLGWVLPMYQKGKAAYARLVEIYEEPIEVQESNAVFDRIPAHPSVEFRDLTFYYSNQKKAALESFNLSIQGGSFIGITGPVGAGKTTLLRLLNREYEIPRGKILLDGHDIHDYSLAALHQAFVTVEQLPFLFSKSIGDNIRFGRRDALQEEIEQAAKQADIHESILEFPLQYETMVGERGVSLSGGQKQRVAIARSLLVNRSILLLDDIFSALDVETERRVFEAIKNDFAGKTVLLITHRISILEQLDRVIYLKDGRIIEEGTPAQLLARKGIYEALVNLQKMHAS
ncbi:ABC transporter ATP-binding protein [Candidatus Protochlamydia phocaeensis]|uniref:ABC transporter ATP-binding protein n=1 Tax=Candidatus Protochlamydia phocaeensis TaxID=1414722 RepID=UPI0008385B56|nr:ABC transporter ATP-binding protein [Candidatus Protochlamydia phocaeensis]